MILTNLPFFSSLSEISINVLQKNAVVRKYDKGDVVHMEDDACHYMEYIISGSVAISYSSIEGDLYTIKILDNNTFISPNNLFASEPRYFVYIEAQEQTEILRIPRRSVKTALMQEDFRESFLTLLSNTGRMMGYKLIYERKMDLRSKILMYLKHQSNIQKSKTIVLPATKTVLANNFGVARTSLSRELQNMRDEGLIRFSSKRIELGKQIL